MPLDSPSPVQCRPESQAGGFQSRAAGVAGLAAPGPWGLNGPAARGALRIGSQAAPLIRSAEFREGPAPTAPFTPMER